MTAWTPQPNSPSPRQLQSHSCGQWLPETFKINNIENHVVSDTATTHKTNVWTCTQLGKPTWHQCPLPPPYTSGWLWWPFQCKSSLSVLRTQTYQISAWWKKSQVISCSVCSLALPLQKPPIQKSKQKIWRWSAELTLIQFTESLNMRRRWCTEAHLQNLCYFPKTYGLNCIFFIITIFQLYTVGQNSI